MVRKENEVLLQYVMLLTIACSSALKVWRRRRNLISVKKERKEKRIRKARKMWRNDMCLLEMRDYVK